MLQILIPVAIGIGLILSNKKEEKLVEKLTIDDTETPGLNKPENMSFYASLFKTMPQEIINYINKNFDRIYGSPFSTSIYSKDGQTWDFTPKNQIRVSDHWNFFSRDYSDPYSEMKQHAVTDMPVDNNTHWTIAKKENGVYKVLLSLPKKQTKVKIKSNGIDRLLYKRKNEILTQQQIKNNYASYAKAQKEREEKIKKGILYVSFDRIYSERKGMGRYAKYETIEEKDLQALLIKETTDFINIKHSKNGTIYKYKKSTLRNYKEHNRKPKSFKSF